MTTISIYNLEDSRPQGGCFCSKYDHGCRPQTIAGQTAWSIYTDNTSRSLSAREDINSSSRPGGIVGLRRRKSDTSIVPTVFQIWTPKVALPNMESSHILDELVTTEAAYLAELRAMYMTIVRPHRIAKVSRNALLSTPCKESPPVTPKRHGRSGSLFSLKSEKENNTPSTARDLADRLRDPMKPEPEHLERAFSSLESMVKAHSAMLSAFLDSKSPYELLSACIVHLDRLQSTYRSFVLTLPYISNSLPPANDNLTNKLSGYSRFLGPLQRCIKYELLLRRLCNALYAETGSIELQGLTRDALKVAEDLCRTLETAQKSEQAKIYLASLCILLGVDVSHKTLVFEGSVSTEALSSKKACKVNYAILFSDGCCFWNSTPTGQERSTKSWVLERITRVEDGGCLDLVVHTMLHRPDKEKAIRRAVGFSTISRPVSTFDSPSLRDSKKSSLTGTVEVVIESNTHGEKRRRKETIVEDWLVVGRAQERQQRRFSLDQRSALSLAQSPGFAP